MPNHEAQRTGKFNPVYESATDIPAHLDIPKHIIPHTTFHGIRLTVFVLDSGSAALAGHLLEALAELGIGLGDGFPFLILILILVLVLVLDFSLRLGLGLGLVLRVWRRAVGGGLGFGLRGYVAGFGRWVSVGRVYGWFGMLAGLVNSDSR